MRVRCGLHRPAAEAGFTEIELNLSNDGDLVEYRMQRSALANIESYDEAYSHLLNNLRKVGFRVGYEELALNVHGDILDGAFLTRPLAELCAGA